MYWQNFIPIKTNIYVREFYKLMLKVIEYLLKIISLLVISKFFSVSLAPIG